MLAALFAIFLFQLAGELLAAISGLPLPGPVLGIALLLIAMMIAPALRRVIGATAQTFLQNLGLVMVPAGVGAVLHLFDLGRATGPVILAITLSTLVAITLGAVGFVTVLRLTQAPPDEPAP